MAKLENISDGQPLAIVNLNRDKEWADYPVGMEAATVTGQEAYERYSEHRSRLPLMWAASRCGSAHLA